jgi:hypothetical protein
MPFVFDVFAKPLHHLLLTHASQMSDPQMVILESPRSWIVVSRLEYLEGLGPFIRDCLSIV